MTAQQLADRIAALPPPALALLEKWRPGLEFLGRCDGDVLRPLAEFVDDLGALYGRPVTGLAANGAPIPPAARHAAPAAPGYTGDVCDACGGARLRRGGTCLVCDDCGSTSGCG
jgi:hypothetical protein